MARRKRSFGMEHDYRKVNRASIRGKGKKLRAVVSIGRSPTGHFSAIACVMGMQSKFYGKGSHCSGLRGGTTPSKAAGHALSELGEAIVKHGR